MKAEEVRLIVCRTVRGEIDNQKFSSRGRRQVRARKVSGQLRDAARAADGRLVLRAAKPRVTLEAIPRLVPLQSAPSNLELFRPDDRIVLEILTYRAAFPAHTPTFLTADGNAAETARFNEVPVFEAPEGLQGEVSWALEPENDENSKELARLKRQVAALSQPPAIDLAWLSDSDEPIQRMILNATHYPALTDGEIAQLLEVIETRFPDQMPQLPGGSIYQSRRDLWPPPLNLGLAPPLSPAMVRMYQQRRLEWRNKIADELTRLHRLLNFAAAQCGLALVIKCSGAKAAEGLLIQINCEAGRYLARSAADSEIVDAGGAAFKVMAPPSPWDYGLGPDPVALPTSLSHALLHDRRKAAPRELAWADEYQTLHDSFQIELGELLHSFQEVVQFRVIAPLHGPGDPLMISCSVHGSNLPEGVGTSLEVRVETHEGSTLEEAKRLVLAGIP